MTAEGGLEKLQVSALESEHLSIARVNRPKISL